MYFCDETEDKNTRLLYKLTINHQLQSGAVYLSGQRLTKCNSNSI